MVLNLRKNILILNDLSISCRLIRSDRRSLGLEIRKIPEGGAELLIRAPRRMKIAYIEWFINEKERWITEKCDEDFDSDFDDGDSYDSDFSDDF